SEARRVHGLAAPHCARRSVVVAARDARPRELQVTLGDASAEARDPRRELSRAVCAAGLAFLRAGECVSARLAVERRSPLAEILGDDVAMLCGAVAAELELRADVRDRET